MLAGLARQICAARTRAHTRMQVEFEEFSAMISKCMHEWEMEEELLDSFLLFDKKERGYLVPEELKRMMICLGEHLEPEDVDDMLDAADVDGDGEVVYEEFVAVIRSTAESGVLGASEKYAHVDLSHQSEAQMDQMRHNIVHLEAAHEHPEHHK